MSAVAADAPRIYAIGDIHGRFDLLEALYAKIRRDLEAMPPRRSLEIFLGDYVDRGPRSRDVLEWLIASAAATDERICLMGNHEDLLLRALDDPAGMDNWLHNGAAETLRSYGIARPLIPAAWTAQRQRTAFIAALPAHHRTFLRTLPRVASRDGYLFVHAGIRPGRGLDEQLPEDLVWIREPFLSSEQDFGTIVVHGHTPTEAPEIRPNRINIDTGAVVSGRLTCLVIEGEERRFLRTGPD